MTPQVIDFIIIGCFIAAFYYNRNMYPAIIAYGLACLYGFTYVNDHSAAANHFIYGLIFLPFCKYATIRLSTGLAVYATFNLFVGLDWLIFPDAEATYISITYDYIQIPLALSLIYLGAGARQNDDRDYPNAGFNLRYLFSVQRHQAQDTRR